jgi:hypothetical protein
LKSRKNPGKLQQEPAYLRIVKKLLHVYLEKGGGGLGGKNPP